MSNDDLVPRLRVLSGCTEEGYEADIIQKAADRIEALEARAAELERALHPLAAIADEYDRNALDEARPEWGDKPNCVEIYSGRGGKRLLTLGDAFAARAALKGQSNEQ